MFYKVTSTLYFSEEDEGTDFYHDCEIALTKASVIHPGQPNQECSVIEYSHCYHDQTPPEPCIVLDHQDNCPLMP